MVLAGFNSNVRMLKKVCKRDLGKQTMLSAHSRAVTHDGSNDAVMQSHRAHVQSRTLICVVDGLVLTLRGGEGGQRESSECVTENTWYFFHGVNLWCDCAST